MLKYIGTQNLLVNNDFEIKKGDIIGDKNLCKSLEHREDFVKIEPISEESEWQDEKIPKKERKIDV